MQKLIVPNKLNKGDTIALISISGGRAGDADMFGRYIQGKKRLEEIWGVHVVATPNALLGSSKLYENPEARADDLMWALENQDINGIICMMGGDDSYRLFPYIDLNVIRNNPKVFMGYSDITSWMAVFAKAGVRAYYGPNVLTPIAQPAKIDEYTKNAITKYLFSTECIGEVKPCDAYTKIEWNDVTENEIKWTQNTGYDLIQGQGIANGRLFGGCIGPLRQIMGTEYFPKPEFFNDCIIMLDTISPYGSSLVLLHDLRALGAAGIFSNAAGVLMNQLSDEEKKCVLKFFQYEVKNEKLPILTNVDFMHRTPMSIFPMGAQAKIDCDQVKLSILEASVR